jgi:twin BRCT domain
MTWILAGSVMQIALELDRSIPVVQSQWLHACKLASQRLPFSNYELLPLAQCCLSFTNLVKRRRLALVEHIERLGGVVSPDMSRNCSHLIVGDVSVPSQKMRCVPVQKRISAHMCRCIDMCLTRVCISARACHPSCRHMLKTCVRASASTTSPQSPGCFFSCISCHNHSGQLRTG